MHIALLADIHANLAALHAALDHAEARHPVDRLWVLGDTVGYGPRPNECIALLRRYPHDAISGNHDLAALGRMETTWFNEPAAEAAAWTARSLSDESRQFLESLPEVVTSGEWTLVHGTLREPATEYLFSTSAATAHLDLQSTPFCAVGHTHIPTLAYVPPDALYATIGGVPEGTVLDRGQEQPAVLNPGGIGQPRDGDPRSAYALLDTDAGTVTFHRVPYDIAATQQAMTEAALPQRLIDRLSVGR